MGLLLKLNRRTALVKQVATTQQRMESSKDTPQQSVDGDKASKEQFLPWLPYV